MKRFKTESISRYINYLYRQGVSFLGNEYKDYNIGAGQYQFLLYLYMKDGITQDELTHKIGVDKAATTRAITKLEENGYVKRVHDEKDKRKHHIFLTEYSKKNKEEIINVSKKWENGLVEELTKEEIEQFYYLLRKITKNELKDDFNEETI
ncbi:MarR family winged helix-turn-helix transcriptional regulator [Clostridium sardiniense]|uniref:MarR family winged helix-turn-helix transcriptional regulator n=1 Tax=Clostridium sardiniense TaxID=29369 RepID=UPI003D3265D0